MKKKIENLIINFLERQELKYSKMDDEKGTITVNFKLDKNPRIYNFIVVQEDGWIVFSTTDALRKEWDLENKDLVALTIAKINFFLRKGSFQFDDTDGELRLKTFSQIIPSMLTDEVVSELLYKDLKNALTLLPRLQHTILEATKGEYIVNDTMMYELKEEEVTE